MASSAWVIGSSASSACRTSGCLVEFPLLGDCVAGAASVGVPLRSPCVAGLSSAVGWQKSDILVCPSRWNRKAPSMSGGRFVQICQQRQLKQSRPDFRHTQTWTPLTVLSEHLLRPAQAQHRPVADVLARTRRPPWSRKRRFSLVTAASTEFPGTFLRGATTESRPKTANDDRAAEFDSSPVSAPLELILVSKCSRQNNTQLQHKIQVVRK